MNHHSAAPKREVVLFGPSLGRVGGYTRNMETYLATLKVAGVAMRPLFHTVRASTGSWRRALPLRMAVDCYRILATLLAHRPDAVHVLGTYRAALPREVFLALMCKIVRIPFVYDIKAGTFITQYQASGWIYVRLVDFVLRQAHVVLAEGLPYISFIRNTFQIDAIYFPNFVSAAEIPSHVPTRLTANELRLLFVGHCYEGKGVFSLVQGCILAAHRSINIHLTFIGEEEEDFGRYLDLLTLPDGLTLLRCGPRNNIEVQAAMLEHDVFCFPSKHIGEGHSNAINEAMLSGMVIACTRHGFLEQVVGEDNGYFMDTGSAEDVEGAIVQIATDRSEARHRAERARLRANIEYTSKRAVQRLATAYERLFPSENE